MTRSEVLEGLRDIRWGQGVDSVTLETIHWAIELLAPQEARLVTREDFQQAPAYDGVLPCWKENRKPTRRNGWAAIVYGKALFYEESDSEYDDPPALFDLFFPAIDTPGEVWGYDITEHDYYGFQSAYDEDAAREQARKRLMRLTKEQLIKLSGLCMEIARQYLSLISRHDALSSVLAILKREEEVRMQTVVRLETLYEEAARDTDDFKYDWGAKSAAFDLALSELPDRIWVE